MIVNWLDRRPRLVDWALLLFALGTTVGPVASRDHRATGIPIAVLACLPLLARRRYPLAVLALTTAATIVLIEAVGSYPPVAVGVALYTVAEVCDRRRSLKASAIALAALALPLWHSIGWWHPLPFVGRLIWFGVAWLIGDSVGTRRRYVRELEDKAERLEREREAEAARAVAEEQARIARELHDLIAHNVSVMVVQAAAGRDVFESRPERALEALRAVEATGRGALAELRRLLGAIRNGDQPDYAPQPGLDRLDELIAQMRATGLHVELAVEGERQPLPTAIELAAFRIVQEALTNTLKHAHATRVEIVVRHGDAALDVEIRDDGRAGGSNGTAAGHGLIGMRERVNVFGGSLAAGPAPGGGFSVAARLPLVAAT